MVLHVSFCYGMIWYVIVLLNYHGNDLPFSEKADKDSFLFLSLSLVNTLHLVA